MERGESPESAEIRAAIFNLDNSPAVDAAESAISPLMTAIQDCRIKIGGCSRLQAELGAMLIINPPICIPKVQL